jgi:hypothetical protein
MVGLGVPRRVRTLVWFELGNRERERQLAERGRWDNGLKSTSNASKHLCESSCYRSSGTRLRLNRIVRRNCYRQQVRMDSPTWCYYTHNLPHLFSDCYSIYATQCSFVPHAAIQSVCVWAHPKNDSYFLTSYESKSEFGYNADPPTVSSCW